MVRHNKTKLNKEKHISKHIWHVNKIKNKKDTSYKTQIKEESWRETHLAYWTQLGWYLTGPTVPTQQDQVIIKGIKVFNSS